MLYVELNRLVLFSHYITTAVEVAFNCGIVNIFSAHRLMDFYAIRMNDLFSFNFYVHFGAAVATAYIFQLFLKFILNI
jgi:hypothetical protein